jgi:hypothetical protein
MGVSHVARARRIGFVSSKEWFMHYHLIARGPQETLAKLDAPFVPYLFLW